MKFMIVTENLSSQAKDQEIKEVLITMVCTIRLVRVTCTINTGLEQRDSLSTTSKSTATITMRSISLHSLIATML